MFFTKDSNNSWRNRKTGGLYMFKFIVKSNSHQIDKLNLFNNPSEGVSLINSSKNKFQSLTITIEMKSPQEVIAIYKKASEFEDVIVL